MKNRKIDYPLTAWKALGLPAIYIILFVLAFSALIVGYSVKANNANQLVPEINEYIQRFNSLPLEERQAIVWWSDINETFDNKHQDRSNVLLENLNPETYLMSEQETQPTFYFDYVFGEGRGLTIFLLITGVLLALLSTKIFCDHCSAIRRRHGYLCQLPSGVYGWVLFFSMFVGWPALLVSYINLRKDYPKTLQV